MIYNHENMTHFQATPFVMERNLTRPNCNMQELSYESYDYNVLSNDSNALGDGEEYEHSTQRQLHDV